MQLTKDNITLVEFHGTELVVPTELADKRIHNFKGLRVFRLVNSDCEEKAIYSNASDSCDLSYLKDKLNTNLVFVGGTKHSDFAGINQDWVTLSWMTAVITNITDDADEILIDGKRLCTPEEVAFLNETFPEYYDHCKVDPNEHPDFPRLRDLLNQGQ